MNQSLQRQTTPVLATDATSATLALLPAVAIWADGQGGYLFDRKFYDGLCLTQQLWGGRLRCIMSCSGATPPAFGLTGGRPAQLPFELIVLRQGERITRHHLRGISTVLASGDSFDQLHVSALCKRMGIACVYAIEYTPTTRLQIATLESKNLLVWLRTIMFLLQGEIRRHLAFRCATALQSNGAPAAHHYAAVCSDVITYFDTRVSRAAVITLAQLEKRLLDLEKGGPLRLAFSGRLIRIKGVDHLVEVARRLRDAKVPFRLTIYGAGDYSQQLYQFVDKHRLHQEVQLAGALDFETQLLPRLREQTDLYLILHRQGDPSCTYLETLSAGIPIVGYDNAAFAGLHALSATGWPVEMDNIDAVVRTIVRLDQQRDEIRRQSLAAREFASQHTFEDEFARRNDQLRRVRCPGGG